MAIHEKKYGYEANEVLWTREVLARIKKNRGKFKQYHVRRIGVFGSYAKGKQDKGSDLDFVIDFEEETSPGDFGKVKDLLEQFFPAIEQDVVIWEERREYMKKEAREDMEKNVIWITIAPLKHNRRCYVGWSEKGAGKGEISVIVIPVGRPLSIEELEGIRKTLGETDTFSEEVITYKVKLEQY